MVSFRFGMLPGEVKDLFPREAENTNQLPGANHYTFYYNYEGSSGYSDSEGNMKFFSNGLRFFNDSARIYGINLLSGRESAPNLTSGSSAVQGVLFVKHRENKDSIFIFTTDDARTTQTYNGLNYYIFSESLNSFVNFNFSGNPDNPRYFNVF